MITRESQRFESLTTEKEYGAYEVEIKQTIEQIRQVSIPAHLIETLQKSLQAARHKLDTLREQVKVSEASSQIQNLFNGLGNNATQDDYLRIRSEIENIIQNVPAAKSEDIYRQTIQNIDQQQNALNSLIKQWQAQYAEIISRHQAVHLKEQVISQKNRFTESASQKTIHELLTGINAKVTELGSQEEAEENVRNTLQEAQKKLQRIRDLTDLPSALQVCQELTQYSLLSISQTSFTKTYKNQLQNFQAQGHVVISQKITNVCNAQLERLEDYKQVSSSLQSIQKLLSSSQDFAEVKSNIEAALQRLPIQCEELQKRQKDKQTIQAIRQYKSALANTIHLCEENIKAVENLRNDLNYPEQLTAEIEQLFEKYKKQASDYRRNLENLRDRLSKVETFKQLEAIQTEYVRLDLVFKDSTDYLPYQQLQEQIDCLKEDIERINSLEQREQDTSIACKEALKLIEDEQANFHDLGRFQPKLSKLKEHLRRRVEEIREHQQQAAKAWLEDLENQATLLKQLTDNTKRYESANNLSKLIHSQKEQHAETLNSEQQQLVQHILDQCIEILRQEQEIQILDLFQQLSREHRISLYQRLSNYLRNTTEEFDG